MDENTLIPSVSIANLLLQRAAILERFSKMQELAEEIQSIEQVWHHVYTPRFEWDSDGHKTYLINYYGQDKEAAKAESRRDYVKTVDRMAWKMLMKESGNLALMDAKAKEEWETSLREGNYPELTLENIHATFADLHAARGEMFDRGVINVFKSLSWHYKTNSPFKLTKRIIVKDMCGYHRTTGGAQLDDLVRCFRVLDNKPEIADYKQTIQSQTSNLQYQHGGQSVIENEYLTIRLHKNNNGHVTFKRLDLVEKLNKIIARHFPFHIPQNNKEAA